MTCATRRARQSARSSPGQFSNGFEGGSGTALDALRESQVNAALDAMAVRRQGIGRSDALEAEGRQAQTEGRFALASGVLGAASPIGGMKSDWAQARSGQSTPAPSSSSGGGGTYYGAFAPGRYS
jgi:hypothetical protein